jgi:protein TonB
MPRAAPRRSAVPPPLSASAQLIGLSTYAVCLLLGFGFGLWAGSRPPRPVEVARADEKSADTRPAEPPAAKGAEKPTPAVTPANPPKKEPKSEAPKPEPPKREPPKKDPPRPAPKKVEPKPEPPVPAANITFAKDIVPVFRSYCLTCHSGAKPKGGVDLTTVTAIMKGKRGKPILKPGDPAASSVFTSVEDGSMPPEGKPPSDAEKKLIRDWILGGAK